MWTPYSALRFASIPCSVRQETAGRRIEAVAGVLNVTTEVRMVHEANGALVSAEFVVAPAPSLSQQQQQQKPPAGISTEVYPTTLEIDLSLMVRYYPRADACDWNFPTHPID